MAGLDPAIYPAPIGSASGWSASGCAGPVAGVWMAGSSPAMTGTNHGTSRILPMCWLDSISLCASDACSSGKVL